MQKFIKTLIKQKIRDIVTNKDEWINGKVKTNECGMIFRGKIKDIAIMKVDKSLYFNVHTSTTDIGWKMSLIKEGLIILKETDNSITFNVPYIGIIKLKKPVKMRIKNDIVWKKKVQEEIERLIT